MAAAKNPVSQLNELFQKRGLRCPEYEFVGSSGMDHQKTFTMRLRHNNQVVDGAGATKQLAKAEAARKAFELWSSSFAIAHSVSAPSLQTQTNGKFVMPSFDPNDPRKSLECLAAAVGSKPVFEVEMFPASFLKIRGTVICQVANQKLEFTDNYFHADEAFAKFQLSGTLFDTMMSNDAIRNLLRMKSSQTASSIIPKAVPERKRVTFHYRSIIQALKERDQVNRDILRSIPDLTSTSSIDSVNILNVLSEILQFSVNYISFPQDPNNHPKPFLQHSMSDSGEFIDHSSSMKPQLHLRICVMKFKEENENRPEPTAHIHGKGSSILEADQNCADNALEYLYYMEAKIDGGLA